MDNTRVATAAAPEAQPENIFTRLYTYRPRERLTPGENFLTEAFAYLLATDTTAQPALLNLLTGGRVNSGRVDSIETQSLREDEEGQNRFILDAIIFGRDAQGASFELWIENKWGSGLSEPQIKKYTAHLRPSQNHFVFISPDGADVEKAKSILAQEAAQGSRMAITWHAIYDTLTVLGGERSLRVEFAEFLRENALGGLRLITVDRAKAYAGHLADVRAAGPKKGRKGDVGEFLRDLKSLRSAALVSIENTSDIAMDDIIQHDQWGRIALMTKDLRLAVGLLYDPTDHHSAFLNPERPLDIVVRVQARRKKNNLTSRRVTLRPLRTALEKIGYYCDPASGRWAENSYTILLGHYRDGFPFDAKTGQEQAKRVAEVFGKTWSVLKRPEFAGALNALPAIREI